MLDSDSGHATDGGRETAEPEMTAINVLFVCTGNVCRSPMAEGFLRDQALRRGLHVDVRSTGTHAWTGRAATIDGRRVMAELGVPIDDHRTLELDRDLMDWADLVICLATEHLREVRRAYPDAIGKTFTLKGFLEILPTLPSCDDTEAWLAAAADDRRVADAVASPDVDDPFGERTAAYHRVATEIEELIRRLAEGLESKRVGAPR
jgi:protein-tyrosine phosphatase